MGETKHDFLDNLKSNINPFFNPGRASYIDAKNTVSVISVFLTLLVPLSFKGGVHAMIYWWHQYVKY